MKELKYYIALLVIPCFTLLAGCSDDDKTDDSDDLTIIYDIKIVNGGVNGDSTIIGIVNENKKEISFPRINTRTDLSKLQFEADLPNRAHLDKETYNFSIVEGESQSRQIISVLNGKREREYLLTIRLDIPVFGANFAKPSIYDYSANPMDNATYTDFTGAAVRGSAFDGEHVLVVSRRGGTVPHLLKVSELMDKTVNPLYLDVTNVVGGTFPIHSGALVNKHVYIASLSGAQASPLKIYYWDTPTSAPQVIADLNIASIAGAGVRHGDNMSVNLDKDGNGYIYFGDNAATTILRLTVTNHTTVSSPVVLPSMASAKASPYMSFNKVDNTADYIFTGYYGPITVANDMAGISYTMSATSTPERGSDARVITFNKERYLIMCTAARNAATDSAPALFVYNITKGETTVEALQLFDARADKSSEYTFSLGGAANASPATQTGWYIEKDENNNDKELYLYAASCDAGFTIFKFPKKTQED